ncbi:alpha/beta hydrolase [Salinimicrobium tongyeongense]|uniref:Alpha/beta hydrolase n=1 Tax=Salinimicrobium tongyeongense TaxID=2809707 RepID=A0ABY6NPZ3_9FLAO|nr:alpha/beta hydrolase [Salinimicrobium tongyeongense]UZH54965.1 alpha/beta hydrolase [Salinimicrobium tongyeongense]
MKQILLCLSLLVLSLKAFPQQSFNISIKGNGQPVLIFPGFTSTPEAFTTIIDVLSEDYEVHAFTFAGFGEVPPIDFPWLETIQQDVLQYINENNLNNPIIIGQSMGGTLGLWLATKTPEISQLIFIGALPAMGALMIPNYDSSVIHYDTPYNQQLLTMDTTAFKAMAFQMARRMSLNEEQHEKIATRIIQSDRITGNCSPGNNVQPG